MWVVELHQMQEEIAERICRAGKFNETVRGIT